MRMWLLVSKLKTVSGWVVAIYLCSIINAFADEAPIATLLGSPIYSNDLTIENKVKAETKKNYPKQYADIIEEMKKQVLAKQVIEGVLGDFFPQDVITLDSTLVAKFKARFKNDFTEQALSDTDTNEIAKEQVLQWQREKALYEKFGGQVIFQQSNPLTPIEAYATLLKQYQQQGKFVIHDKDYADVFWAPFTPPFTHVIPSENVNFTAPWWL